MPGRHAVPIRTRSGAATRRAAGERISARNEGAQRPRAENLGGAGPRSGLVLHAASVQSPQASRQENERRRRERALAAEGRSPQGSVDSDATLKHGSATPTDNIGAQLNELRPNVETLRC
ncbi:hypothetical protein ACFPRL_34380 [Pseudoclavibacter helvolus]